MAAHRKGLTFPSVLIGQMPTEDLLEAKRSVRSEDTEAGRDVATFSGVCSLDVMHETLAPAGFCPFTSSPLGAFCVPGVVRGTGNEQQIRQMTPVPSTWIPWQSEADLSIEGRKLYLKAVKGEPPRRAQ